MVKLEIYLDKKYAMPIIIIAGAVQYVKEEPEEALDMVYTLGCIDQDVIMYKFKEYGMASGLELVGIVETKGKYGTAVAWEISNMVEKQLKKEQEIEN